MTGTGVTNTSAHRTVVTSTVGIRRIGVHVPRYRLTGATVASFWGGKARGARSVANWDEDAVTMAVEAASRCLGDGDAAEVDTVILASTSLPYAEKQSAALVAEALDLPSTVDTIDLASSPRAGTQALRLGADRVHATGRPVLVVVADQRGTPAEDPTEVTVGAAAVAVLLAPDGPATLRWVATGYETWLSHWRLAGERHGHDADGRFVSERSVESLRGVLEQAVKAAVDSGAEVSAVAVTAPTGRDAVRAVAKAGLPESTPVTGPALQSEIGYAGAAAALLSLAAGLERAAEGDVLIWASLGDGADAALVEVGASTGFQRLVQAALVGARPLSYARYLRIREVLPEVAPTPYSSEIQQWRDAQHTARLHAVRCRGCGHVAYPPQPVCAECHRRDDQEPYSLPRHGRLYTFTVEHLYPNAEGRLAMGVIELADGVRFYAPVIDVPPEDLRIGMPVRLVYRRLHVGGQFVNYFWKATADPQGANA